MEERLRGLGFTPDPRDGPAFAHLFDQTVRTIAGIARERGIVAGS